MTHFIFLEPHLNEWNLINFILKKDFNYLINSKTRTIVLPSKYYFNNTIAFYHWTNEQILETSLIFEEKYHTSRKLHGFQVYNIHLKAFKEEQCNIINIVSDSSSDEDNINQTNSSYNSVQEIKPYKELCAVKQAA